MSKSDRARAGVPGQPGMRVRPRCRRAAGPSERRAAGPSERRPAGPSEQRRAGLATFLGRNPVYVCQAQRDGGSEEARRALILAPAAASLWPGLRSRRAISAGIALGAVGHKALFAQPDIMHARRMGSSCVLIFLCLSDRALLGPRAVHWYCTLLVCSRLMPPSLAPELFS